MSQDEINAMFVEVGSNYEKFLDSIGGQDVGEAE